MYIKSLLSNILPEIFGFQITDNMLYIAGGALLVLILVIVFVVSSKRKKSPKSKTAPIASDVAAETPEVKEEIITEPVKEEEVSKEASPELIIPEEVKAETFETEAAKEVLVEEEVVVPVKKKGGKKAVKKEEAKVESLPKEVAPQEVAPIETVAQEAKPVEPSLEETVIAPAAVENVNEPLADIVEQKMPQKKAGKKVKEKAGAADIIEKAEEVKPVEEAKVIEEVKPTEEAKASEEVKSQEEVKSEEIKAEAKVKSTAKEKKVEALKSEKPAAAELKANKEKKAEKPAPKAETAKNEKPVKAVKPEVKAANVEKVTKLTEKAAPIKEVKPIEKTPAKKAVNLGEPYSPKAVNVEGGIIQIDKIDKEFKFYLFSDKNQMLYESAGLPTYSAATARIEEFKKAVLSAEFVIGSEKSGRFRYKLVSNGEVLCEGASCTTDKACKLRADGVRRFASLAKTVNSDSIKPDDMKAKKTKN
jgi:hypothetical protein